ncbi:hypothetical protein AB1K54_13470 [Microbacterium sp. BWT-B31]|uniref:hypothetical protein n=1 Tax=Microbacterium sp. BWT-B31 TaxID=3232072 RepID=UPI003527C803
MSTTSLTPVRAPDTETLELPAAEELARLSRLHRLQLRVGLWLLLHATRQRAASHDHEAHVLAHDRDHARSEREHAALRTHALHTVRS